jgi:hypothetical protein
LGVFLLLALIYQYRFAGVMGLVSILPLAVLLQRGWGWIGQHSQGRQRVYAELALILLVGPLPAVIVPAVADGRSFNTGILLFPVNRARDFCDTYVLEQMLRSPSYFGDRPRLILSTMEMGPEILFRTAHKVLAAPYHMDVQGNIDADRFFETPYASEAEAIARRRHVDLIVLCRALPTIYTRVPEGVIAEGKTQDFAPHFAELLEANKAPKWLKPVPIKALGNFLVFEVLPLKPSVSETKRLQ